MHHVLPETCEPPERITTSVNAADISDLEQKVTFVFTNIDS